MMKRILRVDGRRLMCDRGHGRCFEEQSANAAEHVGRGDLPLWIAAVLAWIIGVLAFASTAHAATGLFSYVEIPAPAGSTNFYINDLNNNGDACGDYWDSNGDRQSYVYLGGAVHTLDNPSVGSTIGARGMNDAGVVVGVAATGATTRPYEPVMWTSPASLTELPLFYDPNDNSPGTVPARAMAINNRNQIAHAAWVSGYHSYVLDVTSSDFVSIHDPNEGFYNSNLFDINDSGVFVGEATKAQYPFAHMGLIGQVRFPAGVQSMETFWVFAEDENVTTKAVNDAGAAVGHATWGPEDIYGNPYFRAFLRAADGTILDLDPNIPAAHRSSAIGINRHGRIVGSRSDFSFDGTAMLFDPAGDPVALQPLVLGLPAGYTLTGAGPINDHGQIAVTAEDSSGGYHALILNPIIVNDLPGGNFTGGLSDWTVDSGNGAVSPTQDPVNPANDVAQMTTGSPVAISQNLNTPTDLFSLDFRYYLPGAAGLLTVEIDDTLIGTIDASVETLNVWHDATLPVTDPALFGLFDAEVKFTFDDASAGAVIYLDDVAFAACTPGDTDCDGDIDTFDLTTATTNFTGAGGIGKGRAHGDTDDDGDVDTADLTFSITNFTGAQAANPNVPDLVYDPATGNVTIDADGADVISFSLQSGPFNAADFSELPAGLTDNIATQIGWTSFNLFSGLTGTANLGAILPVGLDLAGLEAALTTASYGLALSGGGGGGRLDLIIPEPGAMLLLILGAMARARPRRGKGLGGRH